MTIALTYLNLIVALTSALFGIFALFRPTLINPGADGSAGETFFVRMYAARAVPFGVIAGIVPLYFGGWPVAALLFAAALTPTRRRRHRPKPPSHRDDGSARWPPHSYMPRSD